jgi:hypothetical protein
MAARFGLLPELIELIWANCDALTAMKLVVAFPPLGRAVSQDFAAVGVRFIVRALSSGETMENIVYYGRIAYELPAHRITLRRAEPTGRVWQHYDCGRAVVLATDRQYLRRYLRLLGAAVTD